MIELILEMESELDDKVPTFDWIMEIIIFDWMSVSLPALLGQMSTYVWFTKISIWNYMQRSKSLNANHLQNL